jgi:hypothetical protein
MNREVTLLLGKHATHREEEKRDSDTTHERTVASKRVAAREALC